ELVHRAHDIGVRVEGAARETDVNRTVVLESLHQLLAAANYADRQASAERLAIDHHVGFNAEVLLRTAGREAEADEHLVKNQRYASLGASRAKLLQPIGVGLTVEMSRTATVHQRGVTGRVHIGMQRLQWVDQDAGNVLAPAQHAKRFFRHVL